MCIDSFSEHEDILLVKISFFGNNKIEQECYIKDEDCNEMARDAKIKLSSIVDIFYDDKDNFTAETDNSGEDFLFDNNNKAALVLMEALQ